MGKRETYFRKVILLTPHVRNVFLRLLNERFVSYIEIL